MLPLPAVMLTLGHPEDAQGSIRNKPSDPTLCQGDDGKNSSAIAEEFGVL